MDRPSDSPQNSGQPGSLLSLVDGDHNSFQIPIDGSLGLLALGYVGLMSWRGARRKAMQGQISSYQETVNPQNSPK